MRTLILLFVLLGFSLSGYAEPSKTVTYLMNEPMTMFDWGMYRLEEWIDRKIRFDKFHLIKTFSAVDYDWDRNRLTLEFTIWAKYIALTEFSEKALCKELTWYIRGAFGFVPKEEKNLATADMRSLLSLSRFFQHKDFKSGDEPDNLREEIDNIVNIRFDIYASKNDKSPYKHISSCESPLAGEKILYVEKVKRITGPPTVYEPYDQIDEIGIPVFELPDIDDQ